MNWAICTLAFFGFFRLGEILLTTTNFDPERHLEAGDVAIDSRQNPSLLKVHLKCSKTDQLQKGVDIYIGKTGDDICPIAAVLSFLAIRGQEPGPLFVCCDSTPYTKGRFIPKLRSALQAAGLVGPNFAGHSFRIRAATTAAERGIEDSTIKALGRWHSSAFLAYVCTPSEHLATIFRTLSTSPPREQAYRSYSDIRYL